MPSFDFGDPATAKDPFTRCPRALLEDGHWIAQTPSGYVVLTWEDCDTPLFVTLGSDHPAGLGLYAQGITSGRGFEWASQNDPVSRAGYSPSRASSGEPSICAHAT